MTDKQDQAPDADDYTARKASARVMYESTPRATMAQIAAAVGVSKRTLSAWSREDGGWTKLTASAELTARAHAVADTIQAGIDEIPASTSKSEAAKIVDDLTQEQVVEVAVDQRAQILDRHRKELAGPRALIYQAIKDKNFELGKLGKISAEALKIIQESERKAWGIDVGTGETPHVIIERT